MVISQTPYRVSFGGGGTDLPEFYRRGWGAVLSTAITRHLYVCVHGRFSPDVRLAYSQTEIRERAADLEHELAREALRTVGLDAPLEITTIGDVPAGTGLASSSAVTVGLLHALWAHQGRRPGPGRLAREACRIEIERLGKPIGRQDQYAVAYGGVNYLRFLPGDVVEVHPVEVPEPALRALESYCLVLFTGRRRSADAVLARQPVAEERSLAALRRMRALAAEMRDALAAADLEAFGALLDEGWRLKRSLGGISDGAIDDWYRRARFAGALGGKLLGAGAGGFMLFLAPPERHPAIATALGNPRRLAFAVEPRGSRIIFRSPP